MSEGFLVTAHFNWIGGDNKNHDADFSISPSKPDSTIPSISGMKIDPYLYNLSGSVECAGTLVFDVIGIGDSKIASGNGISVSYYDATVSYNKRTSPAARITCECERAMDIAFSVTPRRVYNSSSSYTLDGIHLVSWTPRSAGDHRTLINGTKYAVSGGKVLKDSTAYDVANSKTVLNGTAYELKL